MNKKSVGVYACGFVGSVCYQAFHQLNNWDVKAYDSDPSNCRLGKAMGSLVKFVSIEELAKCDIVFIALPTPFKLSTGECDTSLVENGVAQIRSFNKNNLVVIKSTVPPGTTRKLNFSYGKVCFNPEFLTEENAYKDFINLEYQIVGLDSNTELEKVDSEHDLLKLYQDCFKQEIMKCKEVDVMTSTSAEMVKYIRNCYLGTRLSFFNEIYQVCEKLDVNYDLVKDYAGLDKRVGAHYNNVDPENPGFGGKCLVKDINAFKYLANKLGVKSTVLEAVQEKNLEVRKIYDWLDIPGAATKNE